MDTILSLKEYAERTDIPEEELTGKSRKQVLAVARFIYWFYLNKSDPVRWSSVKIAEIFGREHPAILHGIKQVKNFIDTNDSIIEPYRKDFIEPFLNREQ
ncbi:helix-turn-helix domain-containing protein [Dysgonomonas termitidis]|uniref:Helix-turn-helix domain-containing protein n=1 Tax=Dysgonomonas termitidis TaxID=1516126 RepID=A0ABV9KXB0_9BACT